LEISPPDLSNDPRRTFCGALAPKCTKTVRLITVSFLLSNKKFTYSLIAEFFENGKLPTIRQIIYFLEVYQMKDI